MATMGNLVCGHPYVYIDCTCGCVPFILASVVMAARTQSTNSKASI